MFWAFGLEDRSDIFDFGLQMEWEGRREGNICDDRDVTGSTIILGKSAERQRPVTGLWTPCPRAPAVSADSIAQPDPLPVYWEGSGQCGTKGRMKMREEKPEEIPFCTGGGCTAKLGPDILERVLSKLPKGEKDRNLLVGYDSHDDAAVYQVSEHLAIVQTLDFFPPMVENPYIFGEIAAANALSDVYAMGGEVKTALNIVCFPEKMDLNILGRIMQGGAAKVQEAGGILAGGHSIMDSSVKYGLSVMGTVDPAGMLANNTGREGDVLILTKKLGVGLVCCAGRVGEASDRAMEEAISSMTTLNKAAAEILRRYAVHACTDVTGFGLLGHLHEMLDGRLSARIDADRIPYIPEAWDYADAFLLTAAAQRNRNHVGKDVSFESGIPFAMEEILFDPQTSGGLLAAVKREDADPLLSDLRAAGLPAEAIGELLGKRENEITVVPGRSEE